MRVDVHTHAFPDRIAARAVQQLADNSGTYRPKTDGTTRGLLASMDEAGVDLSFVANIATRPEQAGPILAWSQEIASPRLCPLGSIHPDSPTWESELEAFARAGLVGIKLHPHYQGFGLDEPRLQPIFAGIAEHGMFLLLHAGYDIAFPGDPRALPPAIRRVHERHKRLTLIAAHFGGWSSWGEVVEHLAGTDVFFDTSFLHEVEPAHVTAILNRHGRERLLFGSDSPWVGQSESVRAVERLPLSATEKQMVLGGNAEHLLRAHQRRPRNPIIP